MHRPALILQPPHSPACSTLPDGENTTEKQSLAAALAEGALVVVLMALILALVIALKLWIWLPIGLH